MNLNKEIKDYIKEHAISELPYECCGILIEKNSKLKAIKCENVSYNKREFFEISSLDYLSALKVGEIRGYYHSHADNNTELSSRDKQISIINDLPLIMYSVKSNEFKIC
tara:strand:+ start:2170 stop:2496 length:327 start_codon:yes stop_codon:yes gene_type:complete